jgi:hypothetical protein
VSGHRFSADEAGDEIEVRRVQPYQATKTYRCPGCDHEIAPGIGHVVVVPRFAVDERRHWHRSCWERAARPRR